MGQLFISHTWAPDEEGRDTHLRASRLARAMRRRGWTTWFDGEDMRGDVDESMVMGIEHADAIIVCLTCKFRDKIEAPGRQRSNVYKEWSYAHARQKLVVPIAFESAMLPALPLPPGVLTMHIGSSLVVDGTHDDVEVAAEALERELRARKLQPANTRATRWPTPFRLGQKSAQA